MPEITLTYYAGARAAAHGTSQETYSASTISEATHAAISRHGAELQRVMGLSSYLVNGQSMSAENLGAPVAGDVAVDVLPPFAGG
ncbi:MoaD/ThiS family protein [Jonesia quinghaiensis]|uniref:MoaD/ThiS family protein n=1 Tax=Jonesia quinghaiensis TaxID=262806 RepID=UPI0003F89A5F|nr:MoaD/ThiS family protein [Jonesia quinghaiensis]